MIINTTDLKNGNILNNNIGATDANGNLVGHNGLQDVFGAQFETTRDKYVHRGFALCGIEDITYGKEDKNKSNATLQNTEEADSVLESIRTMTEQLEAMANQVNGIGYREARELFGISDDTDTNGIVTVVEQIQIKLAAALGEDYKGAVNIDISDVEAVMGTSAIAQSVANSLDKYGIPATEENVELIQKAFDAVDKLNAMKREHSGYLVKNDLAPTIANLYKAQSSAGTVYNGIKLEDADWEQLKPQVEQIIYQTFEDPQNVEDIMQTCRWMVEHDIELNKANLAKVVAYEDMNMEEVLATDAVADRMVQAIAMGRKPQDALLIGYEYSGRYIEEMVANLTGRLTETVTNADDITGLTARRQLEEIRLLMTKEAGLMLMKNGIDIDTTELEELVEELKNQERIYFDNLAKLEGMEITDEGIGLFKETTRAMEALRMTPAYVIGGVVRNDFEMTIEATVREGAKLLNSMAGEAAVQGYETLMTRPEREYGDSITKAFRNIDTLLADIGLENTPENNRAVRILAYNSMAITPDNVAAVAYEDSEYQYLLKNLTPRMVLHCIKEGINPLDMNIHELNDFLEEVKPEVANDKEERFSEFLWRLDNSGQIKPEEREAYIGLFRLLHAVDRTNGAAIGSLVNQGLEVTLNNLLMAVRTSKHKNMDIKLDDQAALSSKSFADTSITEQLKFFYEESWKEEYENYKKEEYIKLSKEEEALNLIAREGQAATPNTIKAAAMLLSQNAGLFDKYLNLPDGSKDDKETVRRRRGELNRLAGLVGDKELLADAYEDMEADVAKAVSDYVDEAAADYETLTDMKALYAGFRFLSATAKNNESYYIPLEVSGRMTNVHLKIVRQEDITGVVNVHFTHEEYGDVRAQFKIKGESMEAFIVSDLRAGIDRLKANEKVFATSVEKYGILKGNTTYAVSFFADDTANTVAGTTMTGETEEAAAVSTKVLYGVAKEFLAQLT